MNQLLMNKIYLKNNIQELICFVLFFIFGILLMYYGYFKLAQDNNLFFYSTFLIFWIVLYIIFFGILYKPIYALYSWFAFFLFFPKKPITSDYSDKIFVELFSINNDLIFSVYEVLEIGILSSLIISLVKIKNRLKMDYIEWTLYLVILFGFYHIFYGNSTTISAYQALLAIISGLVLYKSVYIIQNKSQLDFIFDLFVIITCLLSVEYFLGRIDLFPDSINYYIFNYRNAFRSILVSSDLLLGLILMISSLILLYKYIFNQKIFYLLLFFISHFLIIETFNRTQIFALIIVVLIIGLYNKAWKHIVIYIGIIFLLLIPISKMMSSTKLLNSTGSSVNYNYDREGGYLSSASLLDRFGASLRGIDVLIHSNYIGCGPGQAINNMSNNSIPELVDSVYFFNNPNIIKFYNDIINGNHKTNTHMLYTHLLVEYGLIVIILYFFILYKLVYLIKKSMNKNEYRISTLSLSIVLVLIIYYTLQATPIILSIFFFFLHLIEYEIKDNMECDNTAC